MSNSHVCTADTYEDLSNGLMLYTDRSKPIISREQNSIKLPVPPRKVVEEQDSIIHSICWDNLSINDLRSILNHVSNLIDKDIPSSAYIVPNILSINWNSITADSLIELRDYINNRIAVLYGGCRMLNCIHSKVIV